MQIKTPHGDPLGQQQEIRDYAASLFKGAPDDMPSVQFIVTYPPNRYGVTGSDRLTVNRNLKVIEAINAS